MGILSGGILGPVKGKVGAVVGSVVGGQNIIKKMPSSYNDLNSVAQQGQRSAFANTLAWYQALAAIVFEGFKERLAIHSPYNSFMSENVGKGVVTDVPVWASLKVAKGSLGNPNFVVSSTLDLTTIDLDWDDDSDGSSKLSTDEVVFVAINPLTKEIVTSNADSTRADGTLSISLPVTMQNVDLQTYAFVKRADGKKASSSFRTGKLKSGSELAGSVQ